MGFRALSRRSLVYQEAQPSKYLYILISGEVKLFKSFADGRQQIHKIANIPGDLIGCEDLFHPTHSSTAETITDVTLCYITQEQLQLCAERFTEIAETLMRSMSRHLNAYIRHIANLGQKNALERVCSYLAYLGKTHEGSNTPPRLLRQTLTRTELADMLGITQRTLIRSLKRLQQEGVIDLARSGFLVRKPALLKQLAEPS